MNDEVDEPTPEPPTIKRWSVALDLLEQGDLTEGHAVLHAGDTLLTARSTSRRSPHDAAVATVGDEFAAGRALIDLGHQLLRTAERDAAEA